MIRRMESPSISAAVYPKMRVAAAFQLRTTLSSVLPMMASSDDSTMAASHASLLATAVAGGAVAGWRRAAAFEPDLFDGCLGISFVAVARGVKAALRTGNAPASGKSPR